MLYTFSTVFVTQVGCVEVAYIHLIANSIVDIVIIILQAGAVPIVVEQPLHCTAKSICNRLTACKGV